MLPFADFHDYVKRIIYNACFDAGYTEKCAEGFQYELTKINEFILWHTDNMCHQERFKLPCDFEERLIDAIKNIFIINRAWFNESYRKKENENKMSECCNCKAENNVPHLYQDNVYKPKAVVDYELEDNRIRLEYENDLILAKAKRDEALFKNFQKFEQVNTKEMAEIEAFKRKTKYDALINAGFDQAIAETMVIREFTP